jgi:hypothetical protein
MLELRVRDGELEPTGQWVYAWLAEDGVVYVGATALHPETRTWLHLHHDDPDVGRLRARYAALADGELVVLALQLSAEADRQRVRHGAVRQLEACGLLSTRHVCDPPAEVEPPSEAEELVAAVARRYETA